MTKMLFAASDQGYGLGIAHHSHDFFYGFFLGNNHVSILLIRYRQLSTEPAAERTTAQFILYRIHVIKATKNVVKCEKLLS